MYSPSKPEFLEKARPGHLIPVWREVLADQDTPVSAYERLRAALRARAPHPCTFLLESVEGGENIARYSFLGGEPFALITATGRQVDIAYRDGRHATRTQEPLAAVRDELARLRVIPDPALPRFCGGAVGYLGYDAVAQFERAPLAAGPGLGWPDLAMALVDELIIFDRLRHTIRIVAHAHVPASGPAAPAYDAAVARLDTLLAHLATAIPHHLFDAAPAAAEPAWTSNTTRAGFMDMVTRTREYIRAGDIIQAVLSQRLEVAPAPPAPDVYRALRAINPAPYMYCLEFGPRALVGSSPEIHVRCEDGRLEVRPIAGTRPRGRDAAADQDLARELLADPKERAEHIMLVDLARNDLGRVSAYGSVQVPELMAIERYSHVMHIVSDVVGRLAPGLDAFDVLRATFPAGTVSGAPKVRAMEIIAELEAARRGPYAGAVGYVSFTGNLDSCITIRTALLEGGRAYVQAGAGIVADSQPDLEYEETLNKARAVLQALALAQRYAAAAGAAGGVAG